MLLTVTDKKNKKVKEVELSDDLNEKVNKAVLYYGLKAFRNNQRHGTVKVKSRGEVCRTKKKSIRQKGSGGARHGAKSANIFVGGGNVHGPQPRSYSEKLNKKFKAKCYKEAIKYLVQKEGVKVVDQFSFDKPSAKAGREMLAGLSLAKATVIVPADDANAVLSFRNLRDVTVVKENNINLYDILRYENVVLTEAFLNQLKERYKL